MPTKLSASLPKGKANGLAAAKAELVAEPTRVRVAICLIDVSKLTKDLDTDELAPTVRVRTIWPVANEDDELVARRLASNAANHYVANPQLFELDEDLTHDDVDL